MTNNASTTPANSPSSQEFSLIDRLKCFNAKERYWAVRQALGTFQPTEQFVREAATAAGVEPPSESAHSAIFLAMDYHLNWLLAALTPHQPDTLDDRNLDVAFDNVCLTGGSSKRYCFENSMEDVDLLLAYLRPPSRTREAECGFTSPVTQIILIEAKCTSGFTPQQLRSKAERLAAIVEKKIELGPNVSLRLILMSPKGLQKDDTVSTRIRELRALGLGGLLPTVEEEKQGARGWVDLQVASPDDKGLWLVNFTAGVAPNAPCEDSVVVEEDEDSSTDRDKQRWEKWYLRYRGIGKKAKK